MLTVFDRIQDKLTAANCGICAWLVTSRRRLVNSDREMVRSGEQPGLGSPLLPCLEPLQSAR